MKEYKILSACFKGNKKTADKTTASDIASSMKQLFFGGNQFVLNRFNTQKVETLMQKMNQDGWEVVSVVPNPATFQTTGEVLITFERES